VRPRATLHVDVRKNRMYEYSIATHALPTQTVAALRSMLKVLEPMLGSHWQVRDAMPADVLIAPAETLARLPQVARPGKLPLFVAVGTDDTPLPIACATLKRPVTTPGLMDTLQKAASLIERIRQPEPELDTIPLLEKLDTTQKLAPGTLDARLRTALRAATFRLLQAPIAATLIDDARQTIYSVLPGVGYATRLTAPELADQLRENVPTILFELAAEEQRALAQARDFRPMRELEWTFWISARSPWLRTELNREAAYKLTRWPDFGRLAHSHAEVRLASFLMSQPTTLRELSERTGVGDERAMNFFNAAHGLGVLAPVEALDTAMRVRPAVKAPSGIGALIAQVRRKFGFGRTEAVPNKAA
jgi:hypothetical protein